MINLIQNGNNLLLFKISFDSNELENIC